VELPAPGQRQPKILYPADSSLIALDPDIPERLQRLRFQAQGEAGLAWMLDGEALTPAVLAAGWVPAPGKHEVQLVGGDGRVLASARFEVRANAQVVSTFSTSSGGSSAVPDSKGTNSGESER
jgi:penicillin-binding protein 1C